MRYIKSILAIIAILALSGFSPREEKPIEVKVISKLNIPTWYHEGLYFDGKNIWVANGLKGKIWIVDTDNGKVTKEITPIGTFTESVFPIHNDIYITTDWDDKKIYTARIKDNIMSAEKEASTNNAHPAGAVWNGKYLYVITWTRSLTGTRFDLLKMDENFEIIKSHRIDNIQEPSQIAWDGKRLWISSWYDNLVYSMDPDTFDILGYFKSPVKKTTGIAWDGKHMWLTGTYADLYKIDIQN